MHFNYYETYATFFFMYYLGSFFFFSHYSYIKKAISYKIINNNVNLNLQI